MNIKPPMLDLRKVCPCCGQFGLTFSSCPRCRHVLLVCAEVGTIFPDPHDLAKRLPQVYGEHASCPSCGNTTLETFEPATNIQILALGFSRDEYD